METWYNVTVNPFKITPREVTPHKNGKEIGFTTNAIGKNSKITTWELIQSRDSAWFKTWDEAFLWAQAKWFERLRNLYSILDIESREFMEFRKQYAIQPT